jgi:hypothetical protein
MRYMLIPTVLLILLLCVFPAFSIDTFNEEVRDEVVGLFGALLAPSIFTSASSEQALISVHGRLLTAEGEVPNFDGSFEDEINEMTVYVSGRLSGIGLTLGFGEGSDFEFSQPVVVSVDYKASLMKNAPTVDAALDVQYSMIVLPDEEKIEVSALGFGVFSINGLVSANLLSIAEPYAGLTLHYVYLNSDAEGRIEAWKLIPKVGLRAGFRAVSVGTEISFINNKHIDSAWMWELGATVRF